MQKLELLRDKMRDAGLAAVIIPGTDPHQSEYISEHWKLRDWLCGFTGSAGNLIVTQDFAGLWTDGRYFIQAKKELAGSGVELVKLKVPHQAEYVSWLKSNLKAGEKIGIDERLFSEAVRSRMQKEFEFKDLTLCNSGDLGTEIWEDRPALTGNSVYEHSTKYAGKSRTEKLTEIREKMKESGADYLLLTALDDIAWTFNLRGSDVDCNPVFYAFALIHTDGASLYVDANKFDTELQAKLAKDKLELKPYHAVYQDIKSIKEGKILYDPSLTNAELFGVLKSQSLIKKGSIPAQLKGVKNEAEIACTREVMERDGVAMVRFMMWLEARVGKEDISEMDAVRALRGFREMGDNYVGDSFATISGYGPHGAIIHYGVSEESSIPLLGKSLYLSDSGGQYLDGTTDITRMLACGPLTEEEKTDYTLVLQGHIALGQMIFPHGTCGRQLDTMARAAMWKHSINYNHGTGHGVGFFLNVHEGPQRISPAGNGVALVPGMITSNEPGIYRDGKHGIRIENLVLVVPHTENEFATFYKFETLTLCPIDMRPVKMDMLSLSEKKWLKDYHQEVYKRLSSRLNEAEKAWLKNNC